jgi:multisubunit Na+/H+ antiporter MnhB subunit
VTRILVTLFVAVVCAAVLLLANLYPAAETPGVEEPQLREYFVDNFQEDTGAENAVAAIYLNYRVYDTLFEALLLLIAIVGIIHFFRVGLRKDKNE